MKLAKTRYTRKWVEKKDRTLGCPDFSELSARARNILYFYGIDTVEQLAAKEERELRKFRNCGRTVINELRAFLQKRGLDLVNNTPPDISVSELKAQIAELREANANKDIEILQLKAANNALHRLEIQVDRFEQLMSKLFRKERRQALVEELEKLDNGDSL